MLIAPLLAMASLAAQDLIPPSSDDTRSSMINHAPVTREMSGGRTLLTINGRRIANEDGAEPNTAAPAVGAVEVSQLISQRDGVKDLPGCRAAPLLTDGPPAPDQPAMRQVVADIAAAGQGRSEPAPDAEPVSGTDILVRAFTSADVDQDLSLSTEEAKSANLERVVVAYDQNHDGALSISEYLERGRERPPSSTPGRRFEPARLPNLNVSPAVLVNGCPASMTSPLTNIYSSPRLPETPAN